MSTIKVNCIDQALAFDNTPLITSGGMEENFVSFSFCPLWEGFTKTAVFWRNEADAYHVRLDGANTCQIPPEVTTDEGTIFFGVFGVNTASKQRTSAVLTYHIEKGVITLGTAPSDPTPDIYTQILAEVSTAKGLVQETRDAEAAFETDMTAKQSAFETKMSSNQSMFMQQATTKQNAMMEAMARELEQYKNEVAEEAAKGLVPDGTITTARLADAAVTETKLAASAVSYILGKGIQVASGSYDGNGNAGAATPNALNFAFKPLLVVIVKDTHGSTDMGTVMIRGQQKNGGIGHAESSADGLELNLTWTDNGVSWYSNDANNQLNQSAGTYYYFAIGVIE